MRENIELAWYYKGFPCRIWRHPILGHLCGYVGLYNGHPDYGKDYNDVDVEAHGGLTFGKKDSEKIFSDNSSIFWFGFDTAHVFDDEKGWTVQAVKEETENLAEQFVNRR